MEWRLTLAQNSLTIVKFIKSLFIQDGLPTHVTGLLSRVIFRDILVGENFSMARTFKNEFSRDKHDYLAKNLGLSVGFM